MSDIELENKKMFKILKKDKDSIEEKYLGEEKNIYIAQVFFPNNNTHSEIVSAKTIEELKKKAVKSAKELGWKI